MSEKQTFNMDEEFAGLDFNSKRLEKRFVRTMETLSKHPEKSILSCSENRAEAKAIYRMLGNDALDQGEVQRTHRDATIKRMIESESVILAIEDTTSINYHTLKNTEGLGYMHNTSATRGVDVHSCLAVTTDGLSLGLLDQRYFTREEAKTEEESCDNASEEEKKNREFNEKESYRWLESFEASTAGLPSGVKVITVCDREGDIYEFMEAVVKKGQIFLIRIAQNRITVDNERILDAIGETPSKGKVTVHIPRDSRKKIKARDGVLDIRFDCFEIKKPKRLNKNEALSDSITVWVVHAREENPPSGVEPIEWFLMTNEPIETFEEAYERVKYYTHRWKIERFHFVLKSGCQIKKLQERSVEKIKLLVLMYSIISVAIMNLTYIARIHPDVTCTVFFEEEEWKVLYCAANKTKDVPEKPYSMQDAVKYLGWLGGPKMAPSDGPPGLKTIWIGLDRLRAYP